MHYAANFVQLHRDQLSRNLKTLFERANESFSCRMKEVERRNNIQLLKEQVHLSANVENLTYLIVVLTAIVIIVGFFQVLY